MADMLCAPRLETPLVEFIKDVVKLAFTGRTWAEISEHTKFSEAQLNYLLKGRPPARRNVGGGRVEPKDDDRWDQLAKLAGRRPEVVRAQAQAEFNAGERERAAVPPVSPLPQVAADLGSAAWERTRAALEATSSESAPVLRKAHALFRVAGSRGAAGLDELVAARPEPSRSRSGRFVSEAARDRFEGLATDCLSRAAAFLDGDIASPLDGGSRVALADLLDQLSREPASRLLELSEQALEVLEST